MAQGSSHDPGAKPGRLWSFSISILPRLLIMDISRRLTNALKASCASAVFPLLFQSAAHQTTFKSHGKPVCTSID